MTATHTTTHEARLPSDRLLDALERWRDADRGAGPDLPVPRLRVLEANRTIIEHAKGALMLRYGIDSYQAFAVIVRWARVTQIPVPTIAEALVHGICEGNPGTELRQRALMRWLEDQLRHNMPDQAPLPAPTTWARPVG